MKIKIAPFLVLFFIVGFIQKPAGAFNISRNSNTKLLTNCEHSGAQIMCELPSSTDDKINEVIEDTEEEIFKKKKTTKCGFDMTKPITTCTVGIIPTHKKIHKSRQVDTLLDTFLATLFLQNLF
jgi:hypothetical protein